MDLAKRSPHVVAGASWAIPPSPEAPLSRPLQWRLKANRFDL